jgi:6-phosphogluconolactonase
MVRWRVFRDPGELASAAARCILEQAERAIAEHGVFRIVLAGGSTPRVIYSTLAHGSGGWKHWHVYFGDERCLAMGDAGRNDTMANNTWLHHVAIPPGQVHSIPAQSGPHKGALAYRETLSRVGEFDLVLLGLGEDGHTASLFPGRYLGAEPQAPDVLAVESAPKPPADRVSLSANRLSRSKSVKVLVTGAGKRDAVARLRRGENIPICAVNPSGGLDVMLDESAALEID